MVFNPKELKNFIRRHYTEDHPLQIIQQEKDIISDPKEYLAKVELWLKLARLER